MFLHKKNPKRFIVRPLIFSVYHSGAIVAKFRAHFRGCSSEYAHHPQSHGIQCISVNLNTAESKLNSFFFFYILELLLLLVLQLFPQLKQIINAFL